MPELNDTINPTLNRDLWPEYPVHGGGNPRSLQIFLASNSLISECRGVELRRFCD